MAPLVDLTDGGRGDSETMQSTGSVLPIAANHDACEISSDDIAVVGMACRLPGNNNSPADFWKSILGKQVASGDLPAIRWETYYHRDPRNPNILDGTTKRGYYVEGIEEFDAAFFGISPKEAALMDPQQRLALEVTWEALEHAGIPPHGLAGSNTACLMGVNSDDYGKLLLEDLPGAEAWLGIGTAYCGVPNRISYHLDLRGPSTAVDAACASSLVAIHHGRQSLLQGETDLALVGGVQLLANPGMSRVLQLAGAISKDGECRSFDDSANGYGRGEGAAVVVLKRLPNAIQDKDRVLAVIKGTAVGQDGKTKGIMAPNAHAQEAVARKALGDLDPHSIQYVEAHATSTAVGDPVEIGAMASLYGTGRASSAPCFIGSAKANVGHLEAGAGAVGFMKAVLALQNGTIPPQANLRALNKKIDWNNSGITVATEPQVWPVSAANRRAAVCSYGYGGTVSHAVLQRSPLSPTTHTERSSDSPTVLLLTAPQEKRLQPFAGIMRDWLQADGAQNATAAIAATLATRRGHHEFRTALIVDSNDQAVSMLRQVAAGSTTSNVVIARATKKGTARVVWLFSGHGAQWAGMGQELLRSEQKFRSSLEELDILIQRESGFSIVEALNTQDFASTERVQVLTFAMQVALSSLLESKGLRPDAIIGHSVGEIAGAVVAGALSVEDGVRVVCRRATLYRGVSGQGAMALISLSSDQVREMLHDVEGVWVAIEASPSSCVVAGDVTRLELVDRVCAEQGIPMRKVNSDVAFHTPLLKGLAEPLMARLADITPAQPAIPLYSTASRNPREVELRDAHYWVHNMLSPVRLLDAVKAAAEDGFRLFLEVSSHPIISHSVSETLMDLDIGDFAVLPTQLRKKPARRTFLESIGALWCRGAAVQWKQFFSGVKWAHDLPLTQWQHRPYWKSVGTAKRVTAVGHDVNAHTLLGQCIPVGNDLGTIWTSKLSDENKPFPGRHPLHGTEIVPAAVLFNTFLSATNCGSLHDVHLRVPVAISAPRNLQVLAKADHIKLLSQLSSSEDVLPQGEQNSAWLTHTTAIVYKEDDCQLAQGNEDVDIAQTNDRISTVLKPSFSTDYLAGVGVPLMGFPWAVTHHVGNSMEMLAKVDASPETEPGKPLPWHSSSWAPIFDAATSIASTIFYDTPRLRMPAHVSRVVVRPGASPPKIAHIYVKATANDLQAPTADVTIADESGVAVAKFYSMRFAEIEGSPGTSSTSGVEGLIHKVAWEPAQLSEAAMDIGHVVMVSRESKLATSYASQLNGRGISVSAVSPRDFLQQNDTSENPTTILYLAPTAAAESEVASVARKACLELLAVLQHVISKRMEARMFVITSQAVSGTTFESLSQSALVGLSRIVASENPRIWGALVDVEDLSLPYQVLRYISGADVVRIEDTVSKVARLRHLTGTKASTTNRFAPRPQGTYLITGGLGSLGLEVALQLAQNGARRIVLVSRRGIASRREWNKPEHRESNAIKKILALEQLGASVQCLSVDIASPSGASRLRDGLDALALPPVSGVVHAAGLVHNQLIETSTPEAFSSVLAPKLSGTLALGEVFPPGMLDFMVLFSSCGQLLGFPGQGSYASANAFLDSFAEHRRAMGDNAVAIQWTSWKGVGGMGDNALVEAEVENRGITSINRNDAFLAWDYIGHQDVANAVVLRSRAFEHGEELPHPILENVAVRRISACSIDSAAPPASAEPATNTSQKTLPAEGPERVAAIASLVAKCVATVLQLPSPDDVDRSAALPDLGMDSVMTALFRKTLQQEFKVKIPPTLVWGHPTVKHLVGWLSEQLAKS